MYLSNGTCCTESHLTDCSFHCIFKWLNSSVLCYMEEFSYLFSVHGFLGALSGVFSLVLLWLLLLQWWGSSFCLTTPHPSPCLSQTPHWIQVRTHSCSLFLRVRSHSFMLTSNFHLHSAQNTGHLLSLCRARPLSQSWTMSSYSLSVCVSHWDWMSMR